MKLSTRGRYGLRAMVTIARRDGEFTTSEFVAETEEVSKKYLDSILGRLREVGLLKATRGQRGGYMLSRSPEKITAADVVEAVEGKIAIVPCVEDPSSCDRAAKCLTRDIWCSASDAIRGVLAGLTLADLASRTPASRTAEPTYAI